MRDNEQLKRLPSEAFSFDANTLTSEHTLYVGLLSYDRSALLSPKTLVPGFFKAEVDPTELKGIEHRAIDIVSRSIGTRALSAIAALHLPEQPHIRGYLLGAASSRISPEHHESLDAFSHEDIRTSLDIFDASGLEHTPERQLLSILGATGCRYMAH